MTSWLSGAVVTLALALLAAVWRISALVTQLRHLADSIPILSGEVNRLRTDMHVLSTKVEILYDRLSAGDSNKPHR